MNLKSTNKMKFIFSLLFSALILTFSSTKVLAASNSTTNTDKIEVSIFSKHLQFLDCKTLGEKVAMMGFDGIDLTVRPGGHVEPATVKTDLPKAVAEIEKGGSKVIMIATTIESIDNQTNVNILEAASGSGIKYYRPTWYKYPIGKDLPSSLKMYAKQMKELSKLNKKLGLVGCYQNHAGDLVGGSLWEVYDILKLVDKKHFGSQYDIRHAMVEGANSWVNGLELIHPQIKTIVVKDYKWGMVNGKWELINVPIGEGMVDFKKFFRLLKMYHINVPFSLHCEYDLGGAEKGNRKIDIDPQIIYDAMKKDLIEIRRLWKES